MTEVVLGHPYSGALYGFFSDQIGGKDSHTNPSNNHPYYLTLYGKNYRRHTEIALTFLMLYDKIWMTPADNHRPESLLAPGNYSYHPELGLHTDGESFAPFSTNWDLSNKYIESPKVRSLFSKLKIPDEVWGQIIVSALYEAHLSATKRCPLICSEARRELIKLLLELDKPSLWPIIPDGFTADFITSYQGLVGIALAPRTLDELMLAKPDAVVRDYGKKFLEVALTHGRSKSSTTTHAVTELLLNAMETERIASHFSGTIKWVGRFAKFTGLSAIGPLAGIAEASVDYIGRQAGWYEFSGSINKTIEKQRLIQSLQLGLKKSGNN